MSDHHSSSIAGAGTLVLLGAVSTEATSGGVSLWTQFFALAGFAVTLLSALPKIVEGVKLLARWASYLKARKAEKPARFGTRTRED